jgi:glycine/D-amino acid oxidase-like deaminating enzyme
LTDYDVAIIGGGVIGCAAAYFLEMAGVDRICIIEPDPTYSKAATPVATGGCRRLFSLPENIRMSQFSIEFLKEWPEVQWREQGYLFVVGEDHAQVLEGNYQTQQGLGVKVELMDRAGIAARYPWMRTDDLALGVLSPEDGWLDPNSVLQGFRKKAQALGARFLRDRVVDVHSSGSVVTELELESGTRLRPKL